MRHNLSGVSAPAARPPPWSFRFAWAWNPDLERSCWHSLYDCKLGSSLSDDFKSMLVGYFRFNCWRQLSSARWRWRCCESTDRRLYGHRCWTCVSACTCTAGQLGARRTRWTAAARLTRCMCAHAERVPWPPPPSLADFSCHKRLPHSPLHRGTVVPCHARGIHLLVVCISSKNCAVLHLFMNPVLGNPDLQELDLGRERGADRLCLRLPSTVCHVVGPHSPLAHWDEPSGILHDADSEIVVVVRRQPLNSLS